MVRPRSPKHEQAKTPDQHSSDREIICSLFRVSHFAEIVAVLGHNHTSDPEDQIAIDLLDLRTLLSFGLVQGHKSSTGDKGYVTVSNELTERGEKAIRMIRFDVSMFNQGRFVTQLHDEG